jgi:hypothetical protein
VPYPKDTAGAETTICFGKTANLLCQLHCVRHLLHGALLNILVHANTLHPNSAPATTTAKHYHVTDNNGCPEPASGYNHIVTEFHP